MRHLSDGTCSKPGAWNLPGGRTYAYAGLDLFVYPSVAEPALDSNIPPVTWKDLRNKILINKSGYSFGVHVHVGYS